MTPKRLSAKIFLSEVTDVELADYVPVFQRWIQRNAVEGLLIDVADYAHVHHGPGVILIGDEGDYSLDIAEGRPGLLYTRKRAMPNSLQEALITVVRLALAAARQLEQESSLKNPGIEFGEIQLKFLDRLNVPNTPETFDAIKDALQTFANNLYGNAEITLGSDDPREALTVTLKSTEAVEAEALAGRLNKVVAG